MPRMHMSWTCLLSSELTPFVDSFFKQQRAEHGNKTLKIHSVLFSGGPLSALTRCVNARLLSAIKKISPLIYSQSWVGSWVYTTQAMMTFTLIF